MAKQKQENFVVANGCIQQGKEVFIKGDDYVPPSAKIRDELLAAGTIVALRTPKVKAPGSGGGTAPETGGASTGGSAEDDQDIGGQ